MTPSRADELFGRDDVVRRLVDLLPGVSTGSGGLVVDLVGEPGVGKSAVLACVAEEARSAGFTVLEGRGSQSETQLPYAALHQVLRPVLDRVDRLPARQAQSLLACFGMLEAGPDAEVNPFFTSLAVLELVVETAEPAPLLITLDDLHWMDRPTLDTLGFVVRRVGAEQVAFVSTSRSSAHALPGGDSVTRVELDGLDAAAAAALLEYRAAGLSPELRDRVLEQAGGNPLALVEFAASLARGSHAPDDLDVELPMTARLERAFAARADEVPTTTRAALDVAALDDGDDLTQVLEAASVVAGSRVDREAVRPAVELGLLRLSGSTYGFVHPLMASALSQVMSQERREDVHQALATVLSDQPGRAAWHRASAVSGRDEAVAAELERSAADDRRRGAFATALIRLQRAAELSPDPLDRASRLLSAGELGYELGRFTHVERVKNEVTRMTLRPRDRSRLTWLTGVFHDGATSEPSEIRHLVELARHATAEEDPDLAMQLLFGAARRVWWRDPGEVVRGDIISAAREVPLPSADPRMLAVFGLAESAELGALITRELDGLPADGPAGAELTALLGIAAFCAGDFVRADSYLSRAIHELRAEGRLALLAEALSIRAWAEINLGVFDVSRSADEGMRLADETGQRVWAGTARIAIALVDAVRGTWDGRHRLLADAEHTALQLPNASSSLLAGAQLVRGIGELAADRPQQAWDEMHRVFVPTDAAYQRVQRFWTLSYLAEAAVRTGHQDEATRLVDELERAGADLMPAGTAVAVEYCRAVLADDATAEDRFEEALAGAGRPFPWHQARLQLAYGSWLRRQRRVTEARGPLRAARGTFDAVGAKPWALRADHELRATGERGWEPTTSAREALSPQEAQIAALAASGLSNREIGQRLFLSHRTVGSHLYRVFPKLGITSRQQLAGALSGVDHLYVGGVETQSSD